MQSSFHRFRVAQPPRSPAGQPSPAAAAVSPKKEEIRISGNDKITRHTSSAACQRCRRLKKKCSKSRPECTLCITAGLTCSFAESAGGAVTQPASARQLQARIAWLSKCINDVLPPNSTSVEWIETGGELPVAKENVSQVRVGEEISIPKLMDVPSDIMEPLSTVDPVAEPVIDMSPAGSLVMCPPPETNGGHHGIPPEEGIGMGGTSSQHGSLTQGSVASIEVSSPFELQSQRSSRQRLPGEAAGRQFVGAYFRHIHRAYPFMDRAQVLEDIEAMGSLLAEGVDKISTKLYMVMAIGCTTLRRAGQVSEEISAKFKISHNAILRDCLSTPDSIDSMQTLLLLGLHSLFDPTGLSPWIITGILGRQVMALGLSRKATPNQGLSLLQVEMRHRLFWSIYTLDRMVSVSTGLPFSINDDNMNVPLPGVTLEEYGTAERGYYTLVLQVNRHIISLRQLEEKILQKIHLANSYVISQSSQPDRRATVQELRSQIEDWYTQGCLLTPMEERDQIPFHNTIPWLNLRYQNLMLLLYTPSNFNSVISMDHRQELQRSVQKYVQLSAVLFQKRHLPLNWVTLCRYVALCPLLLYCLVQRNTAPGLSDLKDETVICAEVLEAFSETWQYAKRTAKVFRRLATIAGSEESFSLLAERPTPNQEIPAQTDLATLHSVKAEVANLVHDVLGESSSYSGCIDASTEIMQERTNSQIIEQFRTDPQYGNSFLLTDGDVWPGVGELSMEFM